MAHYLQLKSREVAKQSKLEAPATASQLRDEADLQSAVTVLLEHETQFLAMQPRILPRMRRTTTPSVRLH